MKKLFDRRMVAFILIESLMFTAISHVIDPVQQAGVVTMFFNISLASFTVLVGGNVIQDKKAKVDDAPKS